MLPKPFLDYVSRLSSFSSLFCLLTCHFNAYSVSVTQNNRVHWIGLIGQTERNWMYWFILHLIYLFLSETADLVHSRALQTLPSPMIASIREKSLNLTQFHACWSQLVLVYVEHFWGLLLVSFYEIKIPWVCKNGWMMSGCCLFIH